MVVQIGIDDLESLAFKIARTENVEMIKFLLQSLRRVRYANRIEISVRNNPEVKKFYLAVARVLREFIPGGELRNAIIRLCSLTGIDPGSDPELNARLVGGESTRTDPNERHSGDPEEGNDASVLAVGNGSPPVG